MMPAERSARSPYGFQYGDRPPKSEMDLIRQRLKLLRSEVKNAKE